MKRRTFFKWIGSAAALFALPRRARGAALAMTADAPATLDDLAQAILPASLGATGVNTTVKQFEDWIRNYKAGAEMSGGYGFTRLRVEPPDPSSRIWENSGRVMPRLKDETGRMLFGDQVIADWRARVAPGFARVRGYYDVHPARNSELTLDTSNKNQWGDPMPKIVHRLDEQTQALATSTRQHFNDVFERLARADGGQIVSRSDGRYLDHPAGGCRMGTDPTTSVCDSYGRAHDHENLFVVGSPTLPTAGCTNGTLTFVALTLRSATEIAKAVPRRATPGQN